MQLDTKRLLQYCFSLILAGVLCWYVLRVIDVQEMLDRLRQVDFRWIALSSAFSVVAYWSRAKRWAMLIEPLGNKPSVTHSFLALMSGYFVNLFLPRVGEVTRCGVLHKLNKTPVNISFGTVVAERIFDVIMLFAVLCFTFILEFGRLGNFFTELLQSKLAPLTALLRNTVVMGALAALFVALLVLIIVFRRTLQRSRLYLKVAGFISGMAEGLISARKLRNPAAFVFYTLLIWVMYYFMSYVLFFAVPQTADLGWRAGLTILLMGGIGMSAPVQGGFGTFHFLVGNALVMYGLSQQDGIILATFMHTSQTLFMLITGGVSLVISMVLQRSRQEVSISNT